MTHEPTKRIRRQREQRRLERQQERHIAKSTLKDAVRAIGGGDADFWDQDGPDCEWASVGQQGGNGDE